VFRYDHLSDPAAAIKLASETLAEYRAAQKRGDVPGGDAGEEAALVTMLKQNIDRWKTKAS
jgi:hypothetical protein